MEMVQDPNCETYIPMTEAVTATIAGREHFFCSEQCAEEYRNRHNTVYNRRLKLSNLILYHNPQANPVGPPGRRERARGAE